PVKSGTGAAAAARLGGRRRRARLCRRKVIAVIGPVLEAHPLGHHLTALVVRLGGEVPAIAAHAQIRVAIRAGVAELNFLCGLEDYGMAAVETLHTQHHKARPARARPTLQKGRAGADGPSPVSPAPSYAGWLVGRCERRRETPPPPTAPPNSATPRPMSEIQNRPQLRLPPTFLVAVPAPWAAPAMGVLTSPRRELARATGMRAS